MIHKNQIPQDLSIPMPMTQETQQIAQQFANEQPTQHKALQVYLNTLAVCSVNNYLRIMNIPTELTASDSWNPVVRLAADVADLWLTGLGRLECRPVTATELDVTVVQKSNDQRFRFIPQPHAKVTTSLFYFVPPEAQDDRIGYVMVRIDLERKEATLLGFSPTADDLPISQLQSMRDLLEYLESKKLSLSAPVNLSQWWQNIFEFGWQSVESLLNSQGASYAFRNRVANSIKRAKLIDLGTQMSEPSVALAVTLTQQKSANFSISLQVIPIGNKTYVPSGLRLTVLSEAGEAFLEASSGSMDNLIQTRQFSGRSGESFWVKISFNEINITEKFII